MSSLTDNAAAKRQELQLLERTIAERKQYAREQEHLIVDLIDTGNTQLMYLHHEIMLARQELRNLKTDIRTYSRDKVILIQDLEGLQVKVSKFVVV